MNAKSIKKALGGALEAEPRVRLAYLFGSFAWGRPDEESDIDIAVLLENGMNEDARFKLRIKLMGVCAEALHIPDDKIDLIILQDVPPLLKYNATVYGGIPIFERDRSERNLFELKVEQEWDDVYHRVKMENDVILNRLFTNPIT